MCWGYLNFVVRVNHMQRSHRDGGHMRHSEIVRACAEKVHSIFVHVAFGGLECGTDCRGRQGEFGVEEIVPGKYLQCVPGICRSF